MNIDERLSKVFPDPEDQFRYYQRVRADVAREMIETDMAITRIAQDLLEIYNAACPKRMLALLAILAHPLEDSYTDIMAKSGYRQKKNVIHALNKLGEKYKWVSLLLDARREHLRSMSVGAGNHRVVRRYNE
jgi:hypothetical protein